MRHRYPFRPIEDIRRSIQLLRLSVFALWLLAALLFLVVLASVLSAQQPKRWTTPQRVLAVAATVGWAADCSTTAAGLKAGYVEGNILLGTRPSPLRLTLTCVGQAAATLGIAALLPGWERTGWLGLVIVNEGYAVWHNLSVGVGFAVPW